MSTSDVRTQVAVALEAVQSKKAEDVTLLQLPTESSTFTDYFLICSGQNPLQVQAIADEVDERLSKGLGVEPNAREGYDLAEWVLLDYVDFVVHIFNAQRRAYYDLERLWKSAQRLTVEDLVHRKKTVKKAAKKKVVKKKAPARGAAKNAAATRKTAAKKSGKKAIGSKKSAAKKSVKKPATAKKAAAKKTVKKAAKKSAAGAATKQSAAKRTAKKGRAGRK
jgi:ribosome-associated protein